MDIYLIDLAPVLKERGKSNLRKEYGNFHHHYSRIVLNFLLSKIYNLNCPISEESKRPYIENNPIFFSITHSENLLAIAFDKEILGIDAEYIKERDYAKVLKYYGLNCDNISQDEFYQIWTVYEAEYKSKLEANTKTFKYKNYMLSLSQKDNNLPKIYEVTIPTKSMGDNELTNINVVNDNKKNENAVIIQEISIPTSDFLSPSELKIKL